ncbi:MAG: EAL domain-containing protein, partial [Acidimicrobiales bacterium]
VRELGDWTVREAIKAGADVNDHDASPITIAVNLSAIQLGRSDLTESVAAALDFHDLAPSLLAFELTESYLIDQVDSARKTLDELHELGVQLIIDDFGTGYSTFEYLISLPIMAIKIDPSFTRRLAGPRAAAMLRGLATSCAELDMMVVVEGIETAEQLEAARSAGASHAQGFHLGRPVSLDGLGSDLRTGDFAA